MYVRILQPFWKIIFFVYSQSSTVVTTMFYIMKGHSFVWIVSLRAFEGVFVLR